MPGENLTRRVWNRQTKFTYNHWLAALVKGKCMSTKSTRLATGVVCHPDTKQNRPNKIPWSCLDLNRGPTAPQARTLPVCHTTPYVLFTHMDRTFFKYFPVGILMYIFQAFKFLRTHWLYDVAVTSYDVQWYLCWYQWIEEIHYTYTSIVNVGISGILYRNSREGVMKPTLPFGGRVTKIPYEDDG